MNLIPKRYREGIAEGSLRHWLTYFAGIFLLWNMLLCAASITLCLHDKPHQWLLASTLWAIAGYGWMFDTALRGRIGFMGWQGLIVPMIGVSWVCDATQRMVYGDGLQSLWWLEFTFCVGLAIAYAQFKWVVLCYREHKTLKRIRILLREMDELDGIHAP